jgi:hypothetical protein
MASIQELQRHRECQREITALENELAEILHKIGRNCSHQQEERAFNIINALDTSRENVTAATTNFHSCERSEKATLLRAAIDEEEYYLRHLKREKGILLEFNGGEEDDGYEGDNEADPR